MPLIDAWMQSLTSFFTKGYGATTLPALAEAIVYEKNVELAKHEVARLKAVTDGIATTIAV